MMYDAMKFPQIPDRWEALTPGQFNFLFSLLVQLADGRISPALLRIRFVCFVAGVVYENSDADTMDAVLDASYRLTFPLSVVYPDNNAALIDLPEDLRRLARKIPPERLPPSSYAKYLRRLDYRFVIDDCFCAQLIPSVCVNGRTFHAYAVNTAFGNLSCNLAALQYIEANLLLHNDNNGNNALPLLASILYQPLPYDSFEAHRMANDFASLPEETLLAVAFNFRAFTNFLFSKTPFALLAQAKNEKVSPIANGPVEALYGLSADGLGDINTVCRINIIQFLTILRKKTIEFVKSLDVAGKQPSEIEMLTGLDLFTVKQIL